MFAMALLSQFLLLLLLAVGASLGLCPPREDILPCVCRESYHVSFNVRVFCLRVDDVDDVRRALQTVKGIQNVSVFIRFSRLGSVPSDLFRGIHVTELDIENCVIKRFGHEGKSALEGLENSVKKFSVENSFSEENALTFLNVSGLRAMEFLNLRHNNMQEFGNEWFAEGPASLKSIHITFNKITRLGDRAFAQLTNIQGLWIGVNQIETVTRSMFPSPANHLAVIHLSENKISSIPVDMFSNMPVLRKVFLDINSIQHIPETTWTSVWSTLDVLHLDNNPLNCDEEILWIVNKKRPRSLDGECFSPEDRKGKELNEIITAKKLDK